jgi:hypothetical protein
MRQVEATKEHLSLPPRIKTQISFKLFNLLKGCFGDLKSVFNSKSIASHKKIGKKPPDKGVIGPGSRPQA